MCPNIAFKTIMIACTLKLSMSFIIVLFDQCIATGKPYSSGIKLGGAAAAAISPPPRGMEAPRSPLSGASGGENLGKLNFHRLGNKCL